VARACRQEARRLEVPRPAAQWPAARRLVARLPAPPVECRVELPEVLSPGARLAARQVAVLPQQVALQPAAARSRRPISRRSSSALVR
jgi:hypothetical protein